MSDISVKKNNIASKSRIIYPESQLEDYKLMKRRLMNPFPFGASDEQTREQTAVEFDDVIEKDTLIKEQKALAEKTLKNTTFIEEKIVPRLQ